MKGFLCSWVVSADVFCCCLFHVFHILCVQIQEHHLWHFVVTMAVFSAVQKMINSCRSSSRP
ncbi:unnamed protein product [Rhodiola kirilowii]